MNQLTNDRVLARDELRTIIPHPAQGCCWSPGTLPGGSGGEETGFIRRKEGPNDSLYETMAALCGDTCI